MDATIDGLVWFYRQRASAENLIKEANNDAGLAAHPSAIWAANCVHFQLAMLAYNLNCWLMLFNREETVKVEQLRHATLATPRLRFRSCRPRSCGTPERSCCDTAITTPRKACFGGSCNDCGRLRPKAPVSCLCWPCRFV